MSRAKVDVVLIIPEQGRWVYTGPLNCIDFFPFGAQRSHYQDGWNDDKNTRKHALKRALKLELKRQEGKLETRVTN